MGWSQSNSKRVLIEINTYNKKKIGSQSNITPQWTRKEKDQTKPKVRRRKEILKNREEIKNKKSMEKMNATKVGIFF